MARTLWYLNRLRVMPPAEWPHRVKQTLRKRNLMRSAVASFDARVLPEEPHLALTFPLLECADHARYEAVRQRALSPKRNTFSFLNSPERDFSRVEGEPRSPIHWLRDPMSGQHWTGQGYRDQSDLGEIKYVWELGRMPWLLPRAYAANALRDPALARLVIDDILDFARANTPRSGGDYRSIHWQSGIELAIRIVNWTWALALVDPLASPTRDEWATISHYVQLAAQYLALFESRFSSANNHLIAEGAGLEIAGRAWSWLPRAQRWVQQGERILNEQVPRQILPDGSSAEMAPFYLLQALEWTLAVASLRDLTGGVIPDVWVERWKASSEFLRTLCGEEDPLPHLGDKDDGEILPRGESEREYVARVTDNVEQRGKRSSQSRVREDESHQDSLTLFADCGLGVIRRGNARVVFDAGPHGLAPLYAHAHCDALSIMLHVAGEAVLVDPGTYCYHGDPKWRDWFRSTAAHNVLQVDVREQSHMLGPFMWGRVARMKVAQKGEWLEGEHDGFAPNLVRRRVGIAGEVLEIVDDVSGGIASATDIIIRWHFAEGDVKLDGATARWKGKRCWCKMEVICEAGAELRIEQGWLSRRFGVKLECPVVVVKVNPRDHLDSIVQVRTRITWGS